MDAALTVVLLDSDVRLLHPHLLQLVAGSADYCSFMARIFGASEDLMEVLRRFQTLLLDALFSLCAVHIDLQST